MLIRKRRTRVEIEETRMSIQTAMLTDVLPVHAESFCSESSVAPSDSGASPDADDRVTHLPNPERNR